MAYTIANRHFTKGEEDRRDKAAEPDIVPVDLGVRHVSEEQREQERDHQDRNRDLKTTAEQRLRQVRTLEVVCHASQGGTDDQRYQQEEGDGEHDRQREETLPEPTP